METLKNKECREMGNISKEILKAEKQTNSEGSAFICFLHYCVERINKGDSVQVIWNDFQEKAQ